MAGRIRSIKPELLEDEPAAGLSDAAWRLWVSSWLLADDHGRFRAGQRLLAANVWLDTGREDHAREALEELARKGFVRRYQIDGQVYGQIKAEGWRRHQRIDHPGSPRVPVPEDGDFVDPPHRSIRGRVAGITPAPAGNVADLSAVSRNISESLGESRPSRARAGSPISDLRSPISDLRSPTTISDPEGSPTARSPAEKKPREKAQKGTRIADDWIPSEDLIAWAESEPEVRIQRAHVLSIGRAFRDYWLARAGKEGTKLDWTATFRNWLRKERERRRDLPIASANRKPPIDFEARFEAERRKLREQAAAASAGESAVDEAAARAAIAGIGRAFG